MKRIISGLILILSASTANAYFEATGRIEAGICTGFVIKSCSTVSADAVGKDGQLYELSKRYDNVSSYESRTNRCTIRLKGGDAIRNLVSGVASPTFYTQRNGQYEEIDPEHLTFPCRQVR
jgi:hypothetical protein